VLQEGAPVMQEGGFAAAFGAALAALAARAPQAAAADQGAQHGA